MASMVEDVIKALDNLGGQATLRQIYDEVELIRTSSMPKSWQASVRQAIESHSSDSHVFNGKDLFRKVSKGTWALRNRSGNPTPMRIKKQKKDEVEKKSHITESVETLSNMLKTIKEYREYYVPASSSWLEYIQEFFHVIGFSTEKHEGRLLYLKDIGEYSRTKAICAINFPGENFDEIIPELKWETYLSLATGCHHLDWGILTNGMQLKVFNFGEGKTQALYFSSDLETMIENQTLIHFFEVYKVFSLIKADIENSNHLQQIKIIKSTKRNQKASDLPKALMNILDVCQEMSKNGNDYTNACKIVTKQNNLSSPHTVPDACTRRIGINTDGFRKLISDKSLLIDHLTNHYPDFSERIKDTLSKN